MKRIKWENIVGIIVGLLFMQCMIHHIKLNGFEAGPLMFEILIYTLVWTGIYVGVYYLRKDLQ